MKKETKQIGECLIDSGLLWIGDPGSIFQTEDDSSMIQQKIGDWERFCEKTENDEGYTSFEGLGVAVSTGIGDGIYPVFATLLDGYVIDVFIQFLDDEEVAHLRKLREQEKT